MIPNLDIEGFSWVSTSELPTVELLMSNRKSIIRSRRVKHASTQVVGMNKNGQLISALYRSAAD